MNQLEPERTFRVFLLVQKFHEQQRLSNRASVELDTEGDWKDDAQ